MNASSKGGSYWSGAAGWCRSACRSAGDPDDRNWDRGFRLAIADCTLRGGSWSGGAWVCRSACRDRLWPGGRNRNDGFRLKI